MKNIFITIVVCAVTLSSSTIFAQNNKAKENEEKQQSEQVKENKGQIGSAVRSGVISAASL